MSACPKNSQIGLRATTDFLYWSERDAIKKSVMLRDPPLCVWCHRDIGDHRAEFEASMDHVMPRHEGGAYDPDNLVPSCKPCNIERGAMTVLQYLAHRAKQAA